MRGPYDELLNYPHHVSSTRPHLSMAQRAAQFAPFAALTGYEAAVREAGRLTESRRSLDEEQQAMLNDRLCLAVESGGETAFTWFVPDSQKAGGAYVTHVGIVRHLDAAQGLLFLTDGTTIPIGELWEVRAVDAEEGPGQTLSPDGTFF